MEPRRVHRIPAGRFPPQIERQRLDRLPVGMTVQRLQHDHRGDHLRRNRWTAPPRGEQVLKHLRWEQLQSVLGQEPEHTSGSQQMPGHRLHIQHIPLRPRRPLHTPHSSENRLTNQPSTPTH